jgi:hypothetical protein
MGGGGGRASFTSCVIVYHELHLDWAFCEGLHSKCYFYAWTMLLLWVFPWPALCGAFTVGTMRLTVLAFMTYLCFSVFLLSGFRGFGKKMGFWAQVVGDSGLVEGAAVSGAHEVRPRSRRPPCPTQERHCRQDGQSYA